jgi:hypothetical protein
MGHEKAITTFNIYTHRSADRDERIRRALADSSLTDEPKPGPRTMKTPSKRGRDLCLLTVGDTGIEPVTSSV